MKSWKVASASADQTQRLGRLVGQHCPEPAVVLLEGDLGSGKTCFVQGVARGLGVPAEEPVSSPTYTLMNQYRGRCDIAHFDLYRLGSVDELYDLDFDAYLHGSGVALVEWSGMVPRRGLRGLAVQLDYGSEEEERTLKFDALDPSGEKWLRQLAEDWKEN